jgi:hypothetical protein
MGVSLKDKIFVTTIYWILFVTAYSIIVINDLFTMEWNLTILEFLTVGSAFIWIIVPKSYKKNKVQLTFAGVVIGVALIHIVARLIS